MPSRRAPGRPGRLPHHNPEYATVALTGLDLTALTAAGQAYACRHDAWSAPSPRPGSR
ncbi:hypothetical protein [Nocardia jinanensis]|uniref:hypothetical protein n=1 Tax=Nocardia jinanensis TaxID=382504 RepID=UPI000AE99B98|nr:hypothetical protein [Nocardia jinanensis]